MKNFIQLVGAFFIMLLCAVPLQAHATAYDPQEDYKNLNIRFYEDQKPDQGFYINAASRYILETVKEPKMGSTYGEWSVMDLLRGMYTGYDYINYIPNGYFTTYKSGIDSYVRGMSCELDTSKSTEWSRLTLSMTALGYPISNINGCNFIDRLSQSHAFSYRQGINGPIWELIALDTGDYDLIKKPSVFVDGDINTKGRMIDYIIQLEVKGGGWSLFGDADPDITGMALQALAPYYLDKSRYTATDAKTDYVKFRKSVERAIYKLGTLQDENGGYNAWGNVNAESTVQVIVALTALNIDPKTKSVDLPTLGTEASFNKQGANRDGVYTDNMVDALLTFFAPGSGSNAEVAGFKHVTSGYDGGGGSGNTVNAMATDQALYGLIAYDRYLARKNRLYDMTDMKNGEYQSMKANTYTVTFKKGTETKSETYSPYAVVDLKNKFNGEEVIAWTTNETGNQGAQYTATEKLAMPAKNITLYAKTDVRTYSVTYELDGGTLLNGVTTFKDVEGALLPTAVDIRKEGYQFAGWYTNAAFTGNVSTQIPKNTTSNQTFYAKWIEQNAVSNELIILIKNLPTKITQQDIIFVQNARAMYNSLTATEKAKITNIGKLLDAEQQVILLQNNSNSENTGTPSEPVVNDAESVTYLIQQIPAITLQAQSTIANARKAYDALILSDKRQVTNYAVLVRAEKEYELMIGKEVNQEVANRIMQQIEALPSIEKVALSDKEAIAVARVAYDTIMFKQQELVKNYNKLLQLEVQLRALETKNQLKVNAVTNAKKAVTGQTAPNTLIEVYRGTTLLGKKKSDANGTFKVSITKQKADQKLKIIAGNYTTTIVVKTSKKLKKPTITTTKTTAVTGKSTKGYKVEVYKGSKRIGSATVNKAGKFTVKIVKQQKNAKLKIRVVDTMNNKSTYKMIKVN